MPTYSLSDLKTAQTMGVIEARILAAMAAPPNNLPVAAWTPVESGGVERTAVRMTAGALASLLGAKMASAVSGRFLDIATDDLLAYLAAHCYLLARNEATFTIQNVRLNSLDTAPSNNFAAGDVWVASSATGNRYVNIDPIELPPGAIGNLGPMGRFQAELPGASYNDPAGTIETMVTAPAGVSCTNVRPSDYLDPRLSGTSTGTIQAQGQDDDHVFPPVVATMKVRIDVTGDIGSGQFSFKLDDQPWVPVTPIQHVVFVAGPSGNHNVDGGRLIFTESSVAPSFIAGDVFTFLRADAILQQGADAESDVSLRARCRARWTSLSLVPTAGLVKLWAQLASPEVHKVLVDADPDVPGAMQVTLASSAGPASGAAQAAVADYIQARLLGFQGVPAPAIAGSPAETVSVKSAVAKPITPAGLVVVPRARLAAVQVEADRLWLAYLAGLDLGSVVILAELEEALLDAGATTYTGVLMNGGNQNIQLAANEVAVAAPGTSLATNMSWRPT